MSLRRCKAMPRLTATSAKSVRYVSAMRKASAALVSVVQVLMSEAEGEPSRAGFGSRATAWVRAALASSIMPASRSNRQRPRWAPERAGSAVTARVKAANAALGCWARCKAIPSCSQSGAQEGWRATVHARA